MIYLDHNATTPLLPEVVAAMLPYLYEHYYVQVAYTSGFIDADVPANVPFALKEAILAYAPTVMDFSAGTDPAKKNVGTSLSAAMQHAGAVLQRYRRKRPPYLNPIYTSTPAL